MKICGKEVTSAREYSPIAHAEEMRRQADKISKLNSQPPKGAEAFLRRAHRAHQKILRGGR